jgi:hypothetical protein
MIAVFVVGGSVFIARSIILFNPENELLSAAEKQKDTTLDYLMFADASITNLGNSFWGTGAMTSPDGSRYSDTTSVVNVISSLLNVGSTFGWITMILNVVFYWYLFVKTKHAIHSGSYQPLEQLVLIGSLAIVIASVLPLCPTLGLGSNWSPEGNNLPLLKSAEVPPYIYTQVVTAMFYGILTSTTDKKADIHS